MREPRSENEGRAPWHVPLALENVPETGSISISLPTPKCAPAWRGWRGSRDLPRLQASFEVTRHGSGLRVQGRVSATVGQTCVVTLEPLANEVEEAIDLVFAPPSAIKRDGEGAGAEERNPAESWNEPRAVDRRHGRSRRARDGVSHPRA